MNSATQNLETDHEYILRLIDVMGKMIHNPNTSIIHLETVVGLIKNYADGFHHTKEENLLFPLLVKKGLSAEQGPIAVMLHEHVQGRNYVQGMSKGIASIKEGKKADVASVYENMHGYSDLLRNHISKENNILFRMADRMLSETDQQELLKEFEKVENSGFCGEVLKDFISAIENLEKEFK